LYIFIIVDKSLALSQYVLLAIEYCWQATRSTFVLVFVIGTLSMYDGNATTTAKTNFCK
jgi:hypothetical protein